MTDDVDWSQLRESLQDFWDYAEGFGVRALREWLREWVDRFTGGD